MLADSTTAKNVACAGDQFIYENKCYNCNESLEAWSHVAGVAGGVSGGDQQLRAELLEARDCAFIDYNITTVYLAVSVLIIVYSMVMFFYLVRRQSDCDFLQTSGYEMIIQNCNAKMLIGLAIACLTALNAKHFKMTCSMCIFLWMLGSVTIYASVFLKLARKRIEESMYKSKGFKTMDPNSPHDSSIIRIINSYHLNIIISQAIICFLVTTFWIFSVKPMYTNSSNSNVGSYCTDYFQIPSNAVSVILCILCCIMSTREVAHQHAGELNLVIPFSFSTAIMWITYFWSSWAVSNRFYQYHIRVIMMLSFVIISICFLDLPIIYEINLENRLRRENLKNLARHILPPKRITEKTASGKKIKIPSVIMAAPLTTEIYTSQSSLYEAYEKY